MQMAAYYSQYSQPLAVKQAPQDPLRSSVAHLLSRAQNLPCSAGAQSFTQLVPSISRFQLALDVLLPLLDSPVDLSQRVLASYILYSLYAPHPISINPFQSALALTFTKERDVAIRLAAEGGLSSNEQLVWVLWKILKGDGNDIGPFSPSNLARAPVPPSLRAVNLSLSEENVILERPKFDPFEDETPAPAEDSARNTESSSTSQFPSSTPDEASERDKETERLSQGMALLLAARDRVLTLAEQRVLGPLIPQLTSTPIITSHDLPPLIAHNPTLALPIMTSLLSQPSIVTYLDVLKHLPPTLPTLDLLGRLLRDSTSITDIATGGRTTVADLVRTDVLGWFLHESMQWLDWAEEEERAGNISDDRFAKGVQNLCRFYNSLIKLNIVDLTDDADTAEMKHFTLRHSRFEDANALYRILAMSTTF